jgi:hypothetical protein
VETPGALQALGESDAKVVSSAHALFPDLVALERRDLLRGDVTAEERKQLDRKMTEFYRANFISYAEFEQDFPQDQTQTSSTGSGSGSAQNP